MRCARCDRIVAPQSVGRTPDGLVVFGWCLDCMAATGCDQVVSAGADRPEFFPAEWERHVALKPRVSHRPTDRRRRVVRGIAVMLGVWSWSLIVAGVCLIGPRDPREVSPLGNGTPALLLAGGIATGLLGLVLGTAAVGANALLSDWRPLRLVEGLLATAGAPILVASLFVDKPRRGMFVAVACLAAFLGIFVRERRLARPV